MTIQQALEVKEILLQIKGSIPATHVDRIYHYYVTYVNPSMVKPCTCQPKYWNQMLEGLRDKVESVISNQVKLESILSSQATTESDTPTQGKKRGRKKVLS
jgi:hypothetical protein